MNIGQIAYANAKPFFRYWDDPQLKRITGSPRSLAHKARRGDIDAAPLPLVEGWSMPSQFSFLNNWGISVKEESQSVFVFSKKPFSQLNNVILGVTEQSSTSVILAQILIEDKYHHTVRLDRGWHETDEARLVIGDAALQLKNSPKSSAFPFCTDLAAEWWQWHHLPFVFARWVIRTSCLKADEQRLSHQIEQSLSQSLANLEQLAQEEANALHISEEQMKSYLNGFSYELGPEENKSMSLFKSYFDKKRSYVSL